MISNFIYMASSNDNLETPLFVSESAKEMASYMGCSVDSLYSRISKQKHGVFKMSRESTVRLFVFKKENDDYDR